MTDAESPPTFEEKIRAFLESSIEDQELSAGEKSELRLHLQRCSVSELHVARNIAFSLVAQERAPLSWLDRITRTVDVEWERRVPRSSALFSSRDRKCADEIISLLGRTKVNARICVFTISDNGISEAILGCQARGVKVALITDDEKVADMGNDSHRLQRAGVEVRVDGPGYDGMSVHMHHKFAILDNTTLINGSFNWTRSADIRNHENIVVTNEPGLVEEFSSEFNRLWGRTRPLV